MQISKICQNCKIFENQNCKFSKNLKISEIAKIAKIGVAQIFKNFLITNFEILLHKSQIFKKLPKSTKNTKNCRSFRKLQNLLNFSKNLKKLQSFIYFKNLKFHSRSRTEQNFSLVYKKFIKNLSGHRILQDSSRYLI